jgi:hypothetical protein
MVSCLKKPLNSFLCILVYHNKLHFLNTQLKKTVKFSLGNKTRLYRFNHVANPDPKSIRIRNFLPEPESLYRILSGLSGTDKISGAEMKLFVSTPAVSCSSLQKVLAPAP